VLVTANRSLIIYQLRISCVIAASLWRVVRSDVATNEKVRWIRRSSQPLRSIWDSYTTCKYCTYLLV